MKSSKWKTILDKDEMNALKIRVKVLKEDYSIEDIEKIIFSELDSLGLKSEYFLKQLEAVIKEEIIYNQ